MDLNRPNPFNPNKKQIGKDWQIWKQEFLIYLRLSGGYDKFTEEQRSLLLMNLMGTEAIKAIEQMTFNDPDEKNDMEILITKFDKIFDPSLNEMEERYNFFSRRIRKTESIENYVADLRKKASTCNFGTQSEKFIIDMVIRNMNSYLQNLIFELEDITLLEIIQYYKQHAMDNEKIEELTRNAAASLNSANNSYYKQHAMDNEKITELTRNAAASLNSANNSEDTKDLNHAPSRQVQSRCCWRCATRHALGSCPAYGKICNVCNEKHHYNGQCKRHPRGAANQEDFKPRRICSKCGTNHAFMQCPAYDKTCQSCFTKGHYTSQCKQKVSNDSINKNSETSSYKQNEAQKLSDNKLEDCLWCESKHYQGQCRHAASCVRCALFPHNICFHCKKNPHNIDCHYKTVITLPSMKSVNDTEKSSPPNHDISQSTSRGFYCNICKRHGHLTENCAFYPPQNKNNNPTRPTTADPLLRGYVNVENKLPSSSSNQSQRTMPTSSAQNRNNVFTSAQHRNPAYSPKYDCKKKEKPDACSIS